MGISCWDDPGLPTLRAASLRDWILFLPKHDLKIVYKPLPLNQIWEEKNSWDALHCLNPVSLAARIHYSACNAQFFCHYQHIHIIIPTHMQSLCAFIMFIIVFMEFLPDSFSLLLQSPTSRPSQADLWLWPPLTLPEVKRSVDDSAALKHHFQFFSPFIVH